MVDDTAVTLMDEHRIERSLKRIAHQVLEDNRQSKELVIAGINERGYSVARLLQKYLSNLSDSEIALHRLKVEGNGQENKHDFDLTNKYVLLVDDVIFSGTTMYKALQLLSERGKPDEVHTVTLIDRGHRKYPIFAQFVGMELPTKLDEHVRVLLKQKVPSQVILSKSMH